jgi:hypothetical protein
MLSLHCLTLAVQAAGRRHRRSMWRSEARLQHPRTLHLSTEQLNVSTLATQHRRRVTLHADLVFTKRKCDCACILPPARIRHHAITTTALHPRDTAQRIRITYPYITVAYLPRICTRLCATAPSYRLQT